MEGYLLEFMDKVWWCLMKLSNGVCLILRMG